MLTQDLCRVCAVPSGQVNEALDELGLPDAKVLSLDPHTLEEVFASIEVAGGALDRAEEAASITSAARPRCPREGDRDAGADDPRVRARMGGSAFAGGHWVPEMVEAVGAVNLLSEKGTPSRVVAWQRSPSRTPR